MVPGSNPGRGVSLASLHYPSSSLKFDLHIHPPISSISCSALIILPQAHRHTGTQAVPCGQKERYRSAPSAPKNQVPATAATDRHQRFFGRTKWKAWTKSTSLSLQNENLPYMPGCNPYVAIVSQHQPISSCASKDMPSVTGAMNAGGIEELARQCGKTLSKMP